MKELKILNDILFELNYIENQYIPLEYYYVYVTFFNNGNYYIGSRKCNCKPEDDTKYIGSYKLDYSEGEKVILKTFSNENQMTFYETSLILKFKNDINCINSNVSPRVSKPLDVKNAIKTTELMQFYGFSSPTTLATWCTLAEVKKFKQGRYFYILEDEKPKLDELSNFLRSGYGYDYYLKMKGKSEEECKDILMQIKGIS